MTFEPIKTNFSAGVLRITLNRPERLNAVTPELYDKLGEVVLEASTCPSVRCVVLTGAGKAFCAGRDMKAPPRTPAHSAGQWLDDRRDYLKRHAQIAKLLHEMGKPTIAMINGPCVGAGLSLAGACDLRIAGRAAVLASGFIKAGFPGDMGGIWFWSRILGAGRARRLYLLGERFDAAAAADFGLVDQVVDDEALDAVVARLAAEFAAGPARAFRYAKEALNAAEASHLDAIIDLEASHMAIVGIDAAQAAGEIASALQPEPNHGV